MSAWEQHISKFLMSCCNLNCHGTEFYAPLLPQQYVDDLDNLIMQCMCT